MQSTGRFRTVDALGRVVLPMEIRKLLNVGEEDVLEVLADEDKGQIVLRKTVNGLPVCRLVTDGLAAKK